MHCFNLFKIFECHSQSLGSDLHFSYLLLLLLCENFAAQGYVIMQRKSYTKTELSLENFKLGKTNLSTRINRKKFEFKKTNFSVKGC